MHFRGCRPCFCFLQVTCKALTIQYDQLVEYLIPATVPLGPFLCHILACQVQHLFQGTVAWEHAFGLGHFPVLTVQPLDYISRVKPISA